MDIYFDICYSTRLHKIEETTNLITDELKYFDAIIRQQSLSPTTSSRNCYTTFYTFILSSNPKILFVISIKNRHLLHFLIQFHLIKSKFIRTIGSHPPVQFDFVQLRFRTLSNRLKHPVYTRKLQRIRITWHIVFQKDYKN